MKKTVVLLLILFISINGVFSKSSLRDVIFFGAVSSSSDISTIKLTQDLYFNQLSSLNNYNIIDYRDKKWSDKIINDYLDTNVILFYTEIQETDDGWECTITVQDMKTNKKKSQTKTYEGYYKILMQAKTSLLSVFEDLKKDSSVKKSEETINEEHNNSISIEKLAGTWIGDINIAKIVILRSGRGFVIYQNGASMNISISLVGSSIIAIQTGKPNASFFPDIEREKALIMAKNAAPIKWNLSLIDNNTLQGEKETLLPDKSNTLSGVAVKKTVVVWKKQKDN